LLRPEQRRHLEMRLEMRGPEAAVQAGEGIHLRLHGVVAHGVLGEGPRQRALALHDDGTEPAGLRLHRGEDALGPGALLGREVQAGREVEHVPRPRITVQLGRARVARPSSREQVIHFLRRQPPHRTLDLCGVG
jgi:hypothetical protein